MELSESDQKAIERVRGNLAAFNELRQSPVRERFFTEWCGVFSVNVEELLDVLARVEARALVASGTGWPVP